MPLPTYLVELPKTSPSISSAIRVIASWPSAKLPVMGGQHRHATTNLPVPPALSYEQPASSNVKAYLHNNLQLRRMGLAGTDSPPQKTPTTFIANLITSKLELFKDLASAHLDKWPSALYSTALSDKIISRETELRRRAWPAIHCIKKRDQFSSSNMSDRTKEASGNVPLFLNQRGNNEWEGLERFEPTILVKRFKKWREAQDELHLPDDHDADLEALDIEDDLRLLEEEGEFLFRSNLGVEDYKSLCAVDNLMDRFLRMDHHEVPITPTSSNNQGTVLDDADAGDLLQAGQDPVMQLPRIMGWAAFNSDVMQTNSREKIQAMVDPDFVLEQDVTGSTHEFVRGTLKQIWPRLDSVQQHRLLRLLARMLIGVWDNFDILDDDQHDTSPAGQGRDVSLNEQKEIHCQTRPDGAGPWTLQNDADQNTTVAVSQRQSAEDHLRQVEEEFMNRPFFDAVREATKPAQSQPVQHRDQNIDDRLNLPLRTTITVPDRVGRDIHSGGTSTTGGAHSPLNLDDHDTCQRMTTTRARTKESLMVQDRTFILPLRPADTRECGSVRPFDFSLDDLLVQATARQGSRLLPQLQDPTIVGVSRWKSVGPRPPSTPLFQLPKELLPRSSNVFQTLAQGSPYPIVHLFSLPDVLCPVQFGGQEEGGEESVLHGFSHVLVRTLAKHRPLAAEFLTEEVEDKERRMYHRWMAAWHERSPRAPKATRMRFEMMMLLRQHSQEGRRLFASVNDQGNGTNRYRGDGDYCYGQGGGGSWDNSIPQYSSRTGLSHRPTSSPLQQPENNEEADFDYETPSSARCSRCRDEWSEQKRTRRERKRFHEACELLDKMVVDECHRQGGRGGRGEEGRDSHDGQKWTANYARQTQWDQVGKEPMALGLGLSNAQQHSLSQLLSLGLGMGLSAGFGSVGGMGSSFAVGSRGVSGSGEDKSTTGTTATMTGTTTGASRDSHPWRLSEEERAIVETHLWGAVRQRASEQD
ncbi:hypothetical protein BGW39_004497 [Mortierella sp. 14UC]|nr:hypothetical protein BGW39_004497 [Mortierella sp. 14UC]